MIDMKLSKRMTRSRANLLKITVKNGKYMVKEMPEYLIVAIGNKQIGWEMFGGHYSLEPRMLELSHSL